MKSLTWKEREAAQASWLQRGKAASEATRECGGPQHTRMAHVQGLNAPDSKMGEEHFASNQKRRNSEVSSLHQSDRRTGC